MVYSFISADNLSGPEVIFKISNNWYSTGYQPEQMLGLRLDHFWSREDAGVARTAGEVAGYTRYSKST